MMARLIKMRALWELIMMEKWTLKVSIPISFKFYGLIVGEDTKIGTLQPNIPTVYYGELSHHLEYTVKLPNIEDVSTNLKGISFLNLPPN